MREVTVLIIGSGFGGQAAALALRRVGIEDVALLERAAFAGGTWLQNTYPGAAVDVPSPLYRHADRPWDWTELYAKQPELAAYTRAVLDDTGLRERVHRNTNVGALRWNEDAGVWDVATDQGPWRARFVIHAAGPLSAPFIPDVPGAATFQGRVVHTNTWPDDLDLRGKRVAIVGSGASASQVIPAVAPEVADLHVFQRTPHWVMPRPDHTFTPRQRALLRLAWAQRALRAAIYAALELRVIAFRHAPWLLEWRGRRRALRHLRRQVRDPALRARLTPDYQLGCKRVVLSNTLYPALQRDNVTLHDRDDAVASMTPHGLVTTTGATIDVDVLIWATGFSVHDRPDTPEVVGRQGSTLEQAFSPFPRAYLGTTVPRMPNLFLMMGPNTGIGHTSALFVMESQLLYVVRAIRTVLGIPTGRIEPTAEAEERYTAWVHRAMRGSVWTDGGCESWYKHPSGKVIAIFPGFSFVYRALAAWFRRRDHRVGASASDPVEPTSTPR